MALRIRKDGRILCAAYHPAEEGDTYIHDGLHYAMSVENGVIGSESHEQHTKSGQWWWMGNVPDGIQIEEFYHEIAKRMEVGTQHKTEKVFKGETR